MARIRDSSSEPIHPEQITGTFQSECEGLVFANGGTDNGAHEAATSLVLIPANEISGHFRGQPNDGMALVTSAKALPGSTFTGCIPPTIWARWDTRARRRRTGRASITSSFTAPSLQVSPRWRTRRGAATRASLATLASSHPRHGALYHRSELRRPFTQADLLVEPGDSVGAHDVDVCDLRADVGPIFARPSGESIGCEVPPACEVRTDDESPESRALRLDPCVQYCGRCSVWRGSGRHARRSIDGES